MDYTFTQNYAFKYECKKCDFYSNKKHDYERHLQTKKHNDYKNAQNDYACECGNIYTNRQNLHRHKMSCKNTNLLQHNEKWQKMAKNGKKMANSEKCPFFCVCGKSYKHQCSLSKHKKKCILCQSDISDTTMEKFLENFDEKMDKFMDSIIEVAKEPKVIHNTMNNQFNVMNYLNNDCKDAMNLSDFINQFNFSLEDLEMLGTQGYQKTMEETFVKQLKSMDKTKRPIHCSDQKRKSFYIKDNDIWEKDCGNIKLIHNVKKIARKQFNAINVWRHNNDDWLDNDQKHDFFNKSVIEVGKCDKNKEMNKVLSNLSVLSLK